MGRFLGLRPLDIIFRADKKAINTKKHYRDFTDSMKSGKIYKLGVMRRIGKKWKKAFFEVAATTKSGLLGAGGSPLVILDVKVFEDSIGTPLIEPTVHNVSTCAIENYELTIVCHDHRGRELSRFGKSHERFFSDKEIPPRGTGAARFPLYLHDTARGVTVKIDSVQTSDGTIWNVGSNKECPTKSVRWKD